MWLPTNLNELLSMYYIVLGGSVIYNIAAAATALLWARRGFQKVYKALADDSFAAKACKAVIHQCCPALCRCRGFHWLL